MDYGYFTKIWEDNTSTDTPAFAPKLDKKYPLLEVSLLCIFLK